MRTPYNSPCTSDGYDEDTEVALPDTRTSGSCTRRKPGENIAKKESQNRRMSKDLDPPHTEDLSTVTGTSCRRCHDLDPAKFGPITQGLSHHSYSALIDAVSKGCELCMVFSATIGEGVGTAELRFDEKAGIVNYYFRREKKYGTKISAAFDVFSSEGKTVFPKRRQLFSHKNTKSIPLPVYRPIASHPNEKGCFSLAERWLGICVASHPDCKQPDHFSLPTRVIDVAHQRLRLTTEQLHDSRYVTLSYCWGSTSQPMTTYANIEAHKLGLEINALPRTFRDAIEVTRKLGVRYLWIDALCIIQDSDEDKAAECSQMGTYYRNSYITISALSASNSSDGFLKPRLPVAQARFFQNQELYVRPKTMTRAAIFQQAPLSKRGWALQERLLSTRVLHYGDTEIFWECLTCSCREGSTQEHRNREGIRDLVSSEGEDFKRVTFSTAMDPRDADFGAFALWYRLIRQFSQRFLTYPEDALPAMSGLATSMAVNLNLSYVAGLWAEDLDGLLWQVDQRIFYDDTQQIESARVGRVPGIPTWSWASLRQPVVYPFIHELRKLSSNCATFLRSDLNTDASNPYGKLSGGSMTLRAHVIRDIRCYFKKEQLQKRDHNNILNDMRVRIIRRKYWARGREDADSLRGYLDDISTYGDIYDDDPFYYIDIWKKTEEQALERQQVSEKLAATTEFALVCITERTNPNAIQTYERRSVTNSYFLIVAPDKVQEGYWSRVGMGWARHLRIPEDCIPEEVKLV